MKKSIYFLLFFFILFELFSCQSQTEIKVNTEGQIQYVSAEKMNIYYNISLDSTASPFYKFIKISVNPFTQEAPAFLYISTKTRNPHTSDYDISSIEKGQNILYVPRTYFELESQNYFFLNTYCEKLCNYTIEFQQVEMMSIERDVRLGFLTFDYEDYLIKFDKSDIVLNSELMVTASGGAKGHHGSKNNVKLNLYYRKEDGTESLIDVNGDTMFNGAGITFFESSYTIDDRGFYVAKVRGPVNTYINFMVRKIGILNYLPVDGKAIYGFLQGDDLDTLKIINHGIEPEQTRNKKNDGEKLFQLSIVVKGDLTISKSTEELCDIEEQTETINIKDELQAIIKFTEQEISDGYVHICIQGKNQAVKSNAYIVEIHEVTDQKISTIVTEPLVNGYLYTDYLKKDEVRTYRHSKYLEEGLTKYNVKLIEGNIKVAYVKCTTFPECRIDKDAIDGKRPKQFTSVVINPIDNFFTANIDKSLETNAYGPTQYLLSVLCLTNICKFDASFSDEEDSLVLREDSRIAHYISSTSQNYYHFKISSKKEAKKVFVFLRTFSGDANIDVCDDVKEQKRYFIENTEILEFYDNQFTGLYTLNITGNIGTFYALSYSIIKPEEKEEDKIFDIGMGISVVESIKLGYTKKVFSMFHDKTRGMNLTYIANFYPINCKIKVSFFGNEVEPINNIFQHEIDIDNPHYNEDNYIFQVDFISFNEESTYTDKMCFFHISSQELSSSSWSAISEGAYTGFSLTSKTTNPGFLYPHSAGESDILIKYNLENNYPVKMDITIENHPQNSVYFSRSSSYVLPSNLISNYCQKDQFCGINVRFSSRVTTKNDLEIPINFLIKSKNNVPSFLSKNILQVETVSYNTIRYYLVDICPQDKGEISLNFKKGSGKMFAKMVGKDDGPEEGANWNNRVKLPTPEEESKTVGEYNSFSHTIHYDATSLVKYGLPVCRNGCELYIGIISTDEIKEEETKNDYFEYSIMVRPEIDTSSSDPDKHQQLIGQAIIDIPANEYIAGFIENYNKIHYYYIDITNDCDSIEIEFQSESCSLYINEGEKCPDPDDSARWVVKSKLTNTIFVIRKEDIGVDNLKGHTFKMSVNSNSNDQLFTQLYMFRIREPKRTMKTITEINSNIATVCNVTEAEGYCDLVYPLSDYEFNSLASLSVYAESEVISDIDIFYNPVKSYDFDNMNERDIQKILPRKGNNQKTSENQNIKNYIQITNEDFHPEGFDAKPFALISIRSSKPGIINVYTSMREQVLKTFVNPYSFSLFNRPSDILIFFIKGDQPYTFQITCIDGEGEAYFMSQSEDTESHKKISGSGTLTSLVLPEKKDDVLVISPTRRNGLIFYIGENIHPEVRSMELIKFGFSGRLSYQNTPEFPIVYYMKIQDEDESVNINLHLDDLSTSFNPKDGGNYTVVFDIDGYVVDEDMITSMKRNKRINPPLTQAIKGRYDKSITTAKLYITSSQIHEKYSYSNKYIVITLNLNDDTLYEIYSFTTDISIMPFSNALYNSPYNLYIVGNLLKEEFSPACNYHRLRAGNQEDKYMQIEFSTLSQYVQYEITDLNGKEIKYIERVSDKFGKSKGIIELHEENNIILVFCKDRFFPFEREASTNYIFKVKSDSKNEFKVHSLKNNEVTYSFHYDEISSNLDLSIPKILNLNGTKAVEAIYNIRIISINSFQTGELAETISFMPYYAYATYIYSISAEDDLTDIKPIHQKIENFPGDEPYIVSVIGVTTKDEEIFSYKPIINPYIEPDDDESSKYLYILIIIIVFSLIIIGILVYFLIRLYKKNTDLDRQVQEISMKLSTNPNTLSGQNADPVNEPFIKGD